MVEINASYHGSLRCSAQHQPSSYEIETDAPTDNHGKGERFSPTDLVATALGTCMLTTMGIFALRHEEVPLTGARVRILKEMTASTPRRIAQITCELTLPISSDHPLKQALEKAALNCPVYLSLHPDVIKSVSFVWAK